MSQLKVLVIDDDDVVGSVLAEMLCVLGYNAVFLHNAKGAPLHESTIKEALVNVDFVFSDGQMPGFDGSAIIGFALDMGISLDRVTVVTGFLDEPLKLRIMAFGAVRILRKPFTMEQVKAVAESMSAVNV